MAYLVKISLALKPFHKLTYVLAILLIASIIYQLAFSAVPSPTESNKIMLCLLALAWLALVNLMIQVFSRVPITQQNKNSIVARIKNRLHRGLYYLLSVLFVAISMVVILLTFKMLTL